MNNFDEKTLFEWLYEIKEAVKPMQDKHYGLYQLCPKCDGEGQLPSSNTTSLWRTCPVCNGAKLLVRPEIKPG